MNMVDLWIGGYIIVFVCFELVDDVFELDWCQVFIGVFEDDNYWCVNVGVLIFDFFLRQCVVFVGVKWIVVDFFFVDCDQVFSVVQYVGCGVVNLNVCVCIDWFDLELCIECCDFENVDIGYFQYVGDFFDCCMCDLVILFLGVYQQWNDC